MSGLGWRSDWLWCKRTSEPREAKLETSTNSTLCWWKKQHARGLLSARWLMSWPTKAIYWYGTTKVCDAKFAMCTEHTKQFKFWSSHPCVPRPSAAAVISLFQNKKRQLINTAAGNSRHVLDHCGAHNQTSNKHDEKELLHCTSLGYRDIQCTHSHPEHHPLPVSFEPELDPIHTQQCCDYSLSQAAEQSGESHQVFDEIAWL